MLVGPSFTKEPTDQYYSLFKQALPSISLSMILYVTAKKCMTQCVTLCMTQYITAKKCMTQCVTSSFSSKIGCMTQKCMTQNVRPKSLASQNRVWSFFKSWFLSLLQRLFSKHVRTRCKMFDNIFLATD